MLIPNPFSEFDTKENKIKCEIQQGDKKSKTPYKMQIFKGYKNVMIRRDFATFLIHHPVAKKMEEFMHDTIVPDEHIYATMSRIKHIDEIVTGKSFSEVLIVASTNPQYDKRLFMEIP